MVRYSDFGAPFQGVFVSREGREGKDLKNNHEFILLFNPFIFLPSPPKPQLTNTPLMFNMDFTPLDDMLHMAFG